MRALTAVVALASLLGVGCQTPRTFEIEGRTDPPAELHELLGGTGAAEFTPPPGYPLGGHGEGRRRRNWPLYQGGGWPGRLSLYVHQQLYGDDPEAKADFMEPARGVHDGLFARALVLAAGDPPVAFVRFDGAVGTQALHARVVELVADLGFRPEGVIVAATHTHAGVGCYLQAPFARLAAMDNYRPEIFERIARACAAAIRRAFEARRPVAIGFGRAWDRGPDGKPRLMQNRRAMDFADVDPDDVDPEIGLLKVVDAETGELVTCLFNLAVHPDVLGQDNLCYSADLAGAFERELSARLGAPALFFNGAEGDTNPRGPDQGQGGLRRLEEMANRLADVVAPAVKALPAAGSRAAISAVMGRQEFGDPFIVFALGGRRAFVEADDSWVGRGLLGPLTLPINLVLWLAGIDNGRLALGYNLTAGFRFDMSGYTDTTSFPFHALRIRTDAGEALAVSVPGEALHAFGERIKGEGRRLGADQVFFFGLANGAMMYLAEPEQYDRGGYESMVTLFGPDTAVVAERAVRACMREVGYAASAEPAERSP